MGEDSDAIERLIREMPVPAFAHRDARFVLVNRNVTALLGYEEAELLGKPLLVLVEGDDREYVKERLAMRAEDRSGVPTREHHILHKDGTRIPVEVTSVPVTVRGELCPMGVIRDLREKRRLEAQLITADRLASLGRLSAAIGHEINNPLAYVLGSLELIERQVALITSPPPGAHDLPELVKSTREGAERIRAIVADLKMLSREAPNAHAPVDLSRVLDVCSSMAENEIKNRARLVRDYDHALPRVMGTESRLGQVFLNLLVNAAHAIPTGAIEANEVRVEARRVDGAHVAVDVADTGEGVPTEIADRVFEPFVTTSQNGTGLGLSISQHIVASLGGTIALLPNRPRGARFRVVLPSVAGDAGG
jgi:PAS domain S-box-containing protein